MHTPAGPLPFPGQDGGLKAPLEGDTQAVCVEQVQEAQNRSNGVVVFMYPPPGEAPEGRLNHVGSRLGMCVGQMKA